MKIETFLLFLYKILFIFCCILYTRKHVPRWRRFPIVFKYADEMCDNFEAFLEDNLIPSSHVNFIIQINKMWGILQFEYWFLSTIQTLDYSEITIGESFDMILEHLFMWLIFLVFRQRNLRHFEPYNSTNQIQTSFMSRLH